MSSARDLANTHAERLKAAFGDSLTPAKSVECERVAEMLAIADAIRTRRVDEGVGDFSALERAEDMAAVAVRELGTPKPKVTQIQVNYVDELAVQLKDTHLGESEAVLLIAAEKDKLEAERDTLKAENERLRRALERGVVQSTPDQTNAPAATPEASSVRPEQQNADPSNVVPFVGNGSCAIDMPLEQRYPHLREPTW
jgi:hypothetical protein